MQQPRQRPPFLRAWAVVERTVGALNQLQAVAQLWARWFVAAVFFRSGLTKIVDWETTVALFTDEYRVPLLSPELAAALGTGAELVLPVLLVLGLAGRFSAAGLFVLNIVAVISVADMPEPALQQHVFWGSLLAALVLWGPGAWSVDRYAAPWLRARSLPNAGLSGQAKRASQA